MCLCTHMQKSQQDVGCLSVVLCLAASLQDLSLDQKLIFLARLTNQQALRICLSLSHHVRVLGTHSRDCVILLFYLWMLDIESKSSCLPNNHSYILRNLSSPF